PRVFAGTHTSLAAVDIRPVQQLTIGLRHGRTLRAYADGEPRTVLPLSARALPGAARLLAELPPATVDPADVRSEEHTSELQSRSLHHALPISHGSSPAPTPLWPRSTSAPCSSSPSVCGTGGRCGPTLTGSPAPCCRCPPGCCPGRSVCWRSSRPPPSTPRTCSDLTRGALRPMEEGGGSAAVVDRADLLHRPLPLRPGRLPARRRPSPRGRQLRAGRGAHRRRQDRRRRVRRAPGPGARRQGVLHGADQGAVEPEVR